ncbi:PqqD family protein [Candidatus Binatus sp.]|uniref:PqqD family protein n=1 Tax=Candidatus Binatus sp. TaxID=2811406 RepID=UPI003C7234C6
MAKPGKEGLMRVEINDGVTWRDLAGDVVILNVETGVYFGLDGAGGQIWRELVEHGSIEKTLEALERQFDAEPDELRRDLDEIVEQLVKKRLVQLIGEKPKSRLR